MKMDELFEAVKAGNQEAIYNLACEHFITNEGRCNWANINAFERDHPECKIVPLEKDSFGWLIGGIKYEDKTYSYG